jgi:hypothetical protein
MTTADKPVEIRMIPVDKIDVLNPRDRNAKAFNVIVGNIKNVGLKKPIKVTPRTNEAGEERYLLVFRRRPSDGISQPWRKGDSGHGRRHQRRGCLSHEPG